MRAFQIFASMTPEHCEEVFTKIAKQSPATFTQAVYAAAATMKARPQFLAKQPFPKRAASVRRALARVASNSIAEEMLAVYFLECENKVLIEWLDGLGIAHEEGTLKEEAPPQPEEAKLREAIASFRGDGGDPDRLLLLQAFAAQSAIDWPILDEILEAP
jgi:hypothetical protein